MTSIPDTVKVIVCRGKIAAGNFSLISALSRLFGCVVCAGEWGADYYVLKSRVVLAKLFDGACPNCVYILKKSFHVAMVIL